MAALAARVTGMVSGTILLSCASHSVAMAWAMARVGTISSALAGVRTRRPSRCTPKPWSVSLTPASLQKRFAAHSLMPVPSRYPRSTQPDHGNPARSRSPPPAPRACDSPSSRRCRGCPPPGPFPCQNSCRPPSPRFPARRQSQRAPRAASRGAAWTGGGRPPAGSRRRTAGHARPAACRARARICRSPRQEGFRAPHATRAKYQAHADRAARTAPRPTARAGPYTPPCTSRRYGRADQRADAVPAAAPPRQATARRCRARPHAPARGGRHARTPPTSPPECHPGCPPACHRRQRSPDATGGSCHILERVLRRLGRLPLEQVPGALHMLGQRRGQMQDRTGHRMLDLKRPRVQVQLAADITAQLRAPAVAEVLLPRAAVFAIANDRMPDLGHMRTQLVCAPCYRNQRHPRHAPARVLDHRVIGGGGFGTGGIGDLARMNAQHLLPLALGPVPRGLDQTETDRAHARSGGPGDGSPVDLARVAVAERGCQPLGRLAGAGEDQYTGRVLVEPVHEAGLFLIP